MEENSHFDKLIEDGKVVKIGEKKIAKYFIDQKSINN